MIIFGERTFFSIIKLAFRGKREFYLFCYYDIFKDRTLFKQTQSNIEIVVIVVKKHVFLYFVESCKINVKKKVKVNEPRYKRCGVTPHFRKTKK